MTYTPFPANDSAVRAELDVASTVTHKSQPLATANLNPQPANTARPMESQSTQRRGLNVSIALRLGMVRRTSVWRSLSDRAS